MKEIVIPILNYDYKVYLIIGSDKECINYVNKYLKTRYTTEDTTNNRGMTFYKAGFHPVIWLRKGIDDPYNTVTHEAVHAINYIWEYIREDSKEEVYAHSVASIVKAYELKTKKSKL